ncbi:MAG: VOC family protein [Stenomitos rutilans HA7619-LM2]|jgi:catechol 2,3-dioxygenase-like lactoylglutathione lyase family enzyme|nr:VOC family protein [Stenomitos rutilans HA7619-LM2]
MERLIPEIVMNLVVIRAAALERSLRFYTALGLSLVREQHGFGPEHLTATLGTVVLEIYPQGNSEPTIGVRLGFRVNSLVTTMARIKAVDGAIVMPIQKSEWGLRAVVSDPDGHRVELIEAHNSMSDEPE